MKKILKAIAIYLFFFVMLFSVGLLKAKARDVGLDVHLVMVTVMAFIGTLMYYLMKAFKSDGRSKK